MPRLIGIIQIALSLVMVCGLVIGCGVLSSTPTPPPSPYPADVGARVTIAEKVKCATAIAIPPNKEGYIFWIVDVSVKNNAYDDPVKASLETCYRGWEIIANDKVYRPTCCGSPREHPTVSIDLGKTGDFMLYFDVPQDLDISDAQICYQGQEPYSFGKLSGGDKVLAYDWDSKTIITEPEAVAEAENWKIQLDSSSWKGSTLIVNLTITNLGPRRNFGLVSFLNPGPELGAIDSTGKWVEPWVPEPDISKGELFYLPPYTREFYPNESWSGSLKFEMSPYSGETGLYYFSNGFAYTYSPVLLFRLGEPHK